MLGKRARCRGDDRDAATVCCSIADAYRTALSKALVLVGGGANGKDTVQRCFARSFRREGSRALPLTTWARFRKASLTDAWLNCVTELPSRGLHRVEALKALITGEPVQVELKSSTLGSASGGMICSGDTLPQVTDTSDGFWRRWLVVPFVGGLLSTNRFATSLSRSQRRSKRRSSVGCSVGSTSCWQTISTWSRIPASTH